MDKQAYEMQQKPAPNAASVDQYEGNLTKKPFKINK